MQALIKHIRHSAHSRLIFIAVAVIISAWALARLEAAPPASSAGTQLVESGFVPGGGLAQSGEGTLLFGRMSSFGAARAEAGGGAVLTGAVLFAAEFPNAVDHWMLYS